MRTLTRKQTATLCRLCREGMLFEVQDWIAAGRSLQTNRKTGEHPLVLASTNGFHSLVKILLEHGGPPPQECLDEALATAIHGGHCEASRLLLAHGALPVRVNNRTLFNAPNPEILTVALEAGMDLVKGTPLACELICNSEAALRFLARWHAESGLVADQGAMALITAVRRSNERWVMRLRRAGADPRREVLALGPQYEAQWRTTALSEGAMNATFRVLLLLGVRKTDDFDALLEAACWDFDLAKIKHVISRTGTLNDKNGGSTALLHCLRGIGMWYHLDCFARARQARGTAVKLAEMGARFMPNAEEMRDIRCQLRHADTTELVEIASEFLKTGATDLATLGALFGTPAMRRRFIVPFR